MSMVFDPETRCSSEEIVTYLLNCHQYKEKNFLEKSTDITNNIVIGEDKDSNK